LRSTLPYNTYKNAGLPPGPICNPGLASIEAVLNPEPGDYLYFVSAGDGSHVFSKTYTEHLQAKARINRGRSRHDKRTRGVRMSSEVLIVGIAGGSGSGKTTVVRSVSEAFGGWRGNPGA